MEQGYHHQHAQGFAGHTGFEQSHVEYNASTHFNHGAAASADELFGHHDGAVDASPFGHQAASTGDAFSGFGQQTGTAHGGDAAAYALAHSGQHASEGYYANQDALGTEAAFASHGEVEQHAPESYFHDRTYVGVPLPSPAPSASSMFAASSSAPSETRSEFHGSQSFGAMSATASSGFSQHQHSQSFARTETSTSSAETAFAEMGAHDHAHTYPSSAAREFSQADSLSSSGFSDSFGLQSTASAQDFFGDAAGGASSFASSNEFFGSASHTSGDSTSYDLQQPEHAQSSLARDGSDASTAFNDRQHASDNMSGYAHQHKQHEPQSWAQEHAFAQSEFSGGSFEPSAHEATGAPALNDAGEPSREIHEHASASEAASVVNEHTAAAAPPRGGSPFVHRGTSECSTFAPEHSTAASDSSQQQYEATYQHISGQFDFAEPADPSTAFAPALPQHEEDAASVFGTSTQAGDGFGMGDQFAGQEPSIAGSPFSAPPPPAGQDPAPSSYFDEPTNAGYGSFERSPGDEFHAAPSEYFAAPALQHSTPTQHGGGDYGAQLSSLEPHATHDGYGQFTATGYDAADSSYQHQQEHQYHEHQRHDQYQQHAEPFGQTGHGFNESAAVHQAALYANQYAANGAPAGHGAQPSTFYGQTGAGQDAAASSYAPAYNAPAPTGYGQTLAHAPPAMRSSPKYKDPNVPAPSCLASFGFGGNVVTMFPKRKLRLNMASGSFRNSPRALAYVC